MNMLDLFSGIGGFHKGFEQAGFKFDWVGFSEIDKYASAVYKHRFPKSEELGDITIIQPERDLPDHIDIICGGFPCQSFSVAGLRKGFQDTRGTLFFEIARILRYYRESGNPIPCVVLENVKGLLSHDNGRTFAVIHRVLSDLGYTIEFQLLNTRWWLPQNRERIYIVGYIGNRGGPQVFPIGESSSKTREVQRIGDNTRTITTAHSHGTAKHMSYIKVPEDRKLIRIADYRTDEGIRVREDGNSPCLTSSKTSHNDPSRMAPLLIKEDNVRVHTTQPRSGDPKKGGLYKVRGGLQKNASEIENCSTALTEAMGKGGGHTPLLIKEATKKGYAEAEEGDSINLSVPNSKTRRGRVGKGEAQTLDTGMQQYTIQPKILDDYNSKIREDGVTPTLTQNCGAKARRNGMKLLEDTSIRRLTPVECERLQGFPDMWTSKGVMDGKVVDMSDTQRYKQCGNAVTVNVVQAVAERIRPLFEDNKEV